MLLLDLLKHKIAKEFLIIERSSFIIVRIVKSLNIYGFTRRIELYIKHILPSSSLLKNKEVLISNDWGKFGKNNITLYGSRLLLNMTLSLHHRDFWWVIFLTVHSHLWFIIPSLQFWVNATNSFQCRRYVQ